MYSVRQNRENDIFQIIDKAQDRRIGWIFPIQSIVSNQHDLSDNIHFLNYCYASFCNLLAGNINISPDFKFLKSIQYPFPSEPLELNEIFNDDLIIACLSKATLPNDFDFEEYLISLCKQGYFFKRKSENTSIERLIAKPSKILNIYPLSRTLKDDVYIKEIFKNYLLDSTNELFRFHLLYQIVALFIDKIFDIEINKLVQKGYQARELSDKLSKLSTEGHRISLLFNQYTVVDRYDVDDFKLVLNDFLLEFNFQKSNIWEGLYKARNIMVHRYREAIGLKNQIIAINDMFEEIIIESIINFKDNSTPIVGEVIPA